MWVARRSTSSKSWVTRTIGAATVRRTSSSSSCRRRRTCRSTAANGSSSSSTRGSRARARATATRCRSPPDSVARLPLRAVGQVHEREQLGGAGLALAPRTMAQRGHDVLERGQVREERVLLEHEPDGTVVWRQVDAVSRCRARRRHRRGSGRPAACAGRQSSGESSSCRCRTGRRSPARRRERR